MITRVVLVAFFCGVSAIVRNTSSPGNPGIVEEPNAPEKILPVESIEVPKLALPQAGGICNMDQDLTVADLENQYFQCVKPVSDDWYWPQLGVWVLQNCSAGRVFSAHIGGCKNESVVRRHQASMCNNPYGGCGQQIVLNSNDPNLWNPPLQQPWYNNQPYGRDPCDGGDCGQPMVQPNPIIIPPVPQVGGPYEPCGNGRCPIIEPPRPNCINPPCQIVEPVIPVRPPPIVEPVVPVGPPCPPNVCPRPVIKGPCPVPNGDFCSWMLEPLRPGPNKGFLQCVPAPFTHEYCGRWMPRPCAYGTIFNAAIQVCVHDPSFRPRPVCPQPQIPIGHCGANNNCPGQSTCQVPTNMCCQSPYGGY